MTRVGSQRHRKKTEVSKGIINLEEKLRVITIDMRRLTTGKCYEKCVVRRFCLFAKVIQCTYRNLDSIAYDKPSPYGIDYCS
jgi:hypothetical protein